MDIMRGLLVLPVTNDVLFKLVIVSLNTFSGYPFPHFYPTDTLLFLIESTEADIN